MPFLLCAALIVTVGAEDRGPPVLLALEGIRRHQADDGSWHETKPWTADHHLTALAVLAYVGAGYDQRMPSRYKLVMIAALKRLVADAQPDGTLDPDPTWHALHLLALSETYAMSNDPTLKPLVERGVALLVRRMMPLLGNGGAWAATEHPGIVDSETTLIHLLALHSSVANGTASADGCQPVRTFIEHMLAAQEAVLPEPSAPLSFPARVRVDGERLVGEGEAQAVGLALARFAKLPVNSPRYQRLAHGICDSMLPLIGERPLDTWTWYSASLGIYPLRGELQAAWDEPLCRRLYADQVNQPEADDDGLWPADERRRFGLSGGGLATSLWATLILEAHYQFMPPAK